MLSVENLDQNLPAELERLNVLKSVTQSKYRFTVHRRTMLLQALHSFSAYTDKEKDAELVAKLTSQLSQTTADCDQLLEDLLQIADQVGQITHLLDVHWSSALAIALRKVRACVPFTILAHLLLAEWQLRPPHVRPAQSPGQSCVARGRVERCLAAGGEARPRDGRI